MKGLFRRAQGHNQLKEYEEAKRDLLVVLKIEPNNKDARSELEKVNKAHEAFNRSQSKMYAGLFGDS